jgi:cell division protein FtsZ
MADAVLHQGVCGVTDLMIKPGQINLDFADIRAVMGEMGKAMMGTGEASGDARATQAAEAAINNPLLDDTTMKGANAVLINITGGLDMTLFEVDEAANRIRKEVDPDATIIFGSAFDDKLEGVMRVSVVATGISDATQIKGRPSAVPQKTEVVSPRTSTILPNPLSSFLSSAREADVEPATAAMAGTSADNQTMVTSSNLVSAPTMAGDTADILDSQLSNKLVSEATAEVIKTTEDAGQQMDTNDAINAVTQDMATADNDTAASIESDAPSALGDAPTMPLTIANDEAKAPRAKFIPAAPTNMPDEESVDVAAQTPVTRPSSLINRISGLWSSKPESKPTESNDQRRSEPALDESAAKEQIAVSILDLSRSDMVEKALEAVPAKAPNDDEDNLDIPAFLRRQAN